MDNQQVIRIKLLYTTILLFSLCGNGVCQKFDYVADTSVNRIFILLNNASILNAIGDQTGKLINDEKPSRIQFKNLNNSEYLILYHLNGANPNAFNMFEFGVITKADSNYKKYNTKYFYSEKGIRLGMSVSMVINKNIGIKFIKKQDKNLIVLKYVLKDRNSLFLNNYNMPEYRVEYYFKKNKLVRALFGFPNL